jgi:hypothetical protein
MHVRPVAIAIAVATVIGASAFLLNSWGPRVDPISPISVVNLSEGGVRIYVPPERPRSSRFGNAQPCLIDTISCLELAPEPFAPCLLAVERCSGEWRLHPLVGRNAELTR